MGVVKWEGGVGRCVLVPHVLAPFLGGEEGVRRTGSSDVFAYAICIRRGGARGRKGLSRCVFMSLVSTVVLEHFPAKTMVSRLKAYTEA